MDVQDQESQLISKIAKSFNFIIPILLGLVLLVRGKDQSPFETHPSNMWVFMISTFIYYSVTQRSMPLAARISGSLTSVLLLCFFVPHWLGLVLLIRRVSGGAWARELQYFALYMRKRKCRRSLGAEEFRETHRNSIF
ncbi:hypothetical protein LWI29_002308 [Acer saccharum]|uniref:Uncharacterized protein n=1 Tax=Acer saccharum TaxID=4024 RepID=A0AA39S070_ACESA|nr:hypothetical protein LWI29_002308 [Acer saccharum]